MLPRDLSPWGMFMNADIIVKVVMIGLAFASLVTWTICVAKMLELRSETKKVKKRLRVLEHDPSLAQAIQDAGKGRDAVAKLVHAAAREAEVSDIFDGGFTDRVSLRLERIQADLVAALQRHAEREARHIAIDVDGSVVTLSGHVDSLAEHDAALGTAMATRGVTRVIDRLEVGA